MLYNFMQDKHWYEDLGHIFVGFVPGLGWLREHLQWPPGRPSTVDGRLWCPIDRVADHYRDDFGYAIGDILRTIVLIGVIVWALVRR